MGARFLEIGLSEVHVVVGATVVKITEGVVVGFQIFAWAPN